MTDKDIKNNDKEEDTSLFASDKYYIFLFLILPILYLIFLSNFPSLCLLVIKGSGIGLFFSAIWYILIGPSDGDKPNKFEGFFLHVFILSGISLISSSMVYFDLSISDLFEALINFLVNAVKYIINLPALNLFLSAIVILLIVVIVLLYKRKL